MKKIRDFLSRPVVTAVLFVLALGLLGSSTLMGTRAVLNIYSNNYDASVSLPSIGIVLMENGEDAGDTLLEDLLGTDGQLLPGKNMRRN